jgi:hypothetical protein
MTAELYIQASSRLMTAELYIQASSRLMTAELYIQASSRLMTAELQFVPSYRAWKMQSVIRFTFRGLLHVREILQNTDSNFQKTEKQEILGSICLLSRRGQDGVGAAYRLQKAKSYRETGLTLL